MRQFLSSKQAAVIFDCDGVLNHFGGFAAALAERHGITREMTAEFFRDSFNDCLVNKIALEDLLPPFLQSWGWRHGVEEFIRFWLETDNSPRPELIDFASELRSSGILVGVATNQEQHRAAYLRKQMRFAELFDRVFVSCELGCRKPDRAYFNAITAELRLPPDAIIFFDDDPKYVAAARECGWDAQIFISTQECRAAVKAALAQQQNSTP